MTLIFQIEEFPIRRVPDDLERKAESFEADQHHRQADPRDREAQGHPAGFEVRQRGHLL